MFAGHFGVAAAVKAKAHKVPLWAIMVSTQLIDIIFIPLFLAKVEYMVDVTEKSYGGSMIYAFYSHSMIGTLLLAILVGIVSGHFWGRKSGIILGSVVFSHWLLDLLVHRSDLPIFPGNLGNLPLLGFGLWNFTMISLFIEAVLVLTGGFLYFKSIISKSNNGKKTMTVVNGSIMAVILVVSLLTGVMGI